MLDSIMDLFMKFRFSKWWYIMIIIFIIFSNKAIFKAREQSVIKHERIQKIVLYSFGIPLFIIIFSMVCLFLHTGFLGDLANDLSMIMLVVLGGLLLCIPIAYYIVKRLKKGK